MATLTVGAGQQYKTIGAAVAASHDGDVVQVQAGTYTNDFATINTKITLQGVGGMVKMVNTGGWDMPGDKGMFVVNNDVTIDHFEVSGATSSSGNGAGVRLQSGNLTLTNDYFHNNENGILTDGTGSYTVTIKNSEFASNGNPNGSAGTHDIYVGAGASKLTIDNSYFHDVTNEFNLVKSRAAETVITNSRMFDGNGNASYEVDIPNGGVLRMENNVIQQTEASKNPAIVEIGAEGLTRSNNSIYLNNNTIINQMSGRGIALYNPGNISGQMLNTKEYDVNWLQMVSGNGVSESGTTKLSSVPTLDTSHPWETSGSSPTPPPTTPPTNPTTPPADHTAPAAPSAPDLTAASDNGASTTDNITTDTTPTFTGSAEAGAMVKLFDGATQVGSASASSSGAWTITASQLGVGNHAFTATATDAAGNISAKSSALAVSIVAPTTPPTTPPTTDPTPPTNPTTPPSGGAGETWDGSYRAESHTGTAGNDMIRSWEGNDTVAGGAGNDTIDGGYGTDKLTGGAGNDVFRADWHNGKDTITDFHAHGASGSEHDLLDLREYGIHSTADLKWVSITDTSAGAQVYTGDGGFILQGIKAAQLSASDFLLA